MQKAQSRVRSRPAASNKILLYLKRNYWFYLFLIPGMLFLLIFKYIPMGGICIAFQDFKGIAESPWVGLKHFVYLFQSDDFYRVFRNSVLISFYRLLWGFPFPIILALMLNEMRGIR